MMADASFFFGDPTLVKALSPLKCSTKRKSFTLQADLVDCSIFRKIPYSRVSARDHFKAP